MGNIVYNRSKGRVAEFAERVNSNDPTNSIFVFDVLATSGIETDAVLLDKDDFAAVVSGTTNFVTQASIRKTYDQTGGITITYDDTNDRTDVDIPDITWTAVAAGDGFNDVLSGYDSDSAAGTDANILPMTQHDFVVTPDSSDITATVAVFFRAS